MPLRTKKNRNIRQHGEAVQLSKKYKNVKADLPKTTSANTVVTETIVFREKPLEEKQQEVFELSSEEGKEKLQLHTKLEANKLPMKPIVGNRMLMELTINECQKIFKNSILHPIWGSRYWSWTKTNVQGTKRRIRANTTQWKLSLGCIK